MHCLSACIFVPNISSSSSSSSIRTSSINGNRKRISRCIGVCWRGLSVSWCLLLSLCPFCLFLPSAKLFMQSSGEPRVSCFEGFIPSPRDSSFCCYYGALQPQRGQLPLLSLFVSLPVCLSLRLLLSPFVSPSVSLAISLCLYLGLYFCLSLSLFCLSFCLLLRLLLSLALSLAVSPAVSFYIFVSLRVARTI